MSKPNNWYAMSYEERQCWERADRERQDLEYEKDQAREAAEESDRRLRQLKKDYKSTRDDYSQQLAEEQEDHEHTADELDVALRFIRSKGLMTEFQAWDEKEVKLS